MSDLPNLYIPGAMKSGTSSLWKYLDKHPDIFMSEIKEPSFWIDDKKYPDLESYRMLFRNGSNHLYRGDASAMYMAFDTFAERIKIHTPDAKLICILRNPIDRVWSHYWFLRGRGFARMPFKETFLESVNATPDFSQLSITDKGQYYYSFGLYGRSLSRIYDKFDRANILILETNQLKNFPLKTVNSCFRFLNLSELNEITEENLNPTILLSDPDAYYKRLNFMYGNNPFKRLLKHIIPKSFGQKFRKGISDTMYAAMTTKQAYPAMTVEERNWVASYYRDDVALLKQVTGMSFPEWQDFI